MWLLYVLSSVNFLFVLLCGALLWLQHTNAVQKRDLQTLLQKSAEMLSEDYGRRLKGIEVEWDDYYQKFARLAGRYDRQRALAPPPPPAEPAPTTALTHTDVMRRWRNR